MTSPRPYSSHYAIPEGSLATCIERFTAGESIIAIAKSIGSNHVAVGLAVSGAMGELTYQRMRRSHQSHRASERRLAGLESGKKPVAKSQCRSSDSRSMQLVWRLMDWRGSIIQCGNCNVEVDAVPAEGWCVKCNRHTRWERLWLNEKRSPEKVDTRPDYLQPIDAREGE